MKNNFKLRAYDVLGNIAIVKFPDGLNMSKKKEFASRIMKENKGIKTVLEKTRRFKGRLRKQETKYIAGERTKEALYKENECVFRFNVDKTYFSPRLSNERKEVASMIKSGENVLVMFAGVAPFPIIIAKNTKAKQIYSNELNREANKYAKLNIELNKVKGRVILMPGDIKKVAKKLAEQKKKFDVIIMPRPQLRDSFLKEAFSLSKSGTRIYYYDFCREDEIEDIVNKIKEEAERLRKRVKILKTKEAGEIGPYKIRVRADFRIL
jgi:tRNA (guanine37-N1)-methyltransferase